MEAIHALCRLVNQPTININHLLLPFASCFFFLFLSFFPRCCCLLITFFPPLSFACCFAGDDNGVPLCVRWRRKTKEIRFSLPENERNPPPRPDVTGWHTGNPPPSSPEENIISCARAHSYSFSLSSSSFLFPFPSAAAKKHKKKVLYFATCFLPLSAVFLGSVVQPPREPRRLGH